MEKNIYLHRKCPICRLISQNNASVFSPKRAEDCNYDYLVPCWNGFFKEKIYFSYVVCDTCNLLYAPIFYNENQLTDLYSQMPPNMDVVPIEALKKTQAGYFSQINSLKLTGDFLEVGPDVGMFAELCSKQGKFNKFWLFEPNASVHEALSQSVKGSEHLIIEDMSGFSMIPNGSIGLVVMIQVLDHLLDPVSTLIELRQKMMPNARLLLVTHNEQSLLRKLAGWKWPAFCLQHPQIYNPRSIETLLVKAGFQVDSIKRTTNYFEFSFLVRHLLWIMGISVSKLPKILNFKVGLKLGNIITIARPFNENKTN